MPQLGSDDTPVVADNIQTRVAEIDDTDSPYLTQSENEIHADTSNGAITVTIASDDIPASGEPSRSVTIINTSTNDLTIETEGSETIYPDDVSSLTITTDNVFVTVNLVAGGVYVDRNVSRNKIESSEVVMDTGVVNTDAVDPTDIPTYQQLISEGGASVIPQESRPEVGADGDLWYPQKQLPNEARVNKQLNPITNSHEHGEFDEIKRNGNTIITTIADENHPDISTSDNKDYLVELNSELEILNQVDLNVYRKSATEYDKTNDVFYVYGQNLDNGYALLLKVDPNDFTITTLLEKNLKNLNGTYTPNYSNWEKAKYSPESNNVYFTVDDSNYDPVVYGYDIDSDSILFEKQPYTNYESSMALSRTDNDDYVAVCSEGNVTTYTSSGSNGEFSNTDGGIRQITGWDGNGFLLLSYNLDGNYEREIIKMNQGAYLEWNYTGISNENINFDFRPETNTIYHISENSFTKIDVSSSDATKVYDVNILSDYSIDRDANMHGFDIFTIDSETYITEGTLVFKESTGEQMTVLIDNDITSYGKYTIVDESKNTITGTNTVNNESKSTIFDIVSYQQPYVYNNGRWRTVR